MPDCMLGEPVERRASGESHGGARVVVASFLGRGRGRGGGRATGQVACRRMCGRCPGASREGVRAASFRGGGVAFGATGATSAGDNGTGDVDVADDSRWSPLPSSALAFTAPAERPGGAAQRARAVLYRGRQTRIRCRGVPVLRRAPSAQAEAPGFCAPGGAH